MRKGWKKKKNRYSWQANSLYCDREWEELRVESPRSTEGRHLTQCQDAHAPLRAEILTGQEDKLMAQTNQNKSLCSRQSEQGTRLQW